MRSASLYRVSGNCLMYAGLLWAAGIVLMPRGPMATLEDLTALSGPAWIVSTMLMVLGSMLGLAGMLGIYRHFAGGEREGWALLFLSTITLGLVLSVLANTVSGIGISILVRLANGADPAAFGPAAAGIVSTVAALYNVANLFTGLAFVPLSVAMLRDRAWPRVLPSACLAYALLVLGGPFVLIPRQSFFSAPGTSTPFRMSLLLGFAFVVVLGGTFVRMGAPASAPAPEVGAGA